MYNKDIRKFEHFSAITDIDPLFYSSITNNPKITKTELNKKYGLGIGANEDLNEILKNTTQKKATCEVINNNNSVTVRIPQPKNYTPDLLGLDSIINYYNKTITGIKDLMGFGNPPMDTTKCKKFYAVYCENIKKDLEKTYPGYSNDDLLLYAPECACYADTTQLAESIGDEAILNQINNIPRKCKLKQCDKSKWNPETNDDAACGNITLCMNQIKVDNATIGKDINMDNLKFVNNCSGDQTSKVDEVPAEQTRPIDGSDTEKPINPVEPVNPSNPVIPIIPVIPSTPIIPNTPSNEPNLNQENPNVKYIYYAGGASSICLTIIIMVIIIVVIAKRK